MIQETEEIRNLLSEYRDKHKISFQEDTHTYFINGKKGKYSVSKLLKAFYKPFDSHSTKAFLDCGGDKSLQSSLLKSWNKKGSNATNQGSRTHFFLEDYAITLYGSFKEVRLPIFDCTPEQIEISDAMIHAGKNFIDLMHERGCVLLDTETVLGSKDLGYFGQPDKIWLCKTKSGKLGFIITDWKSNKPKNFEVQSYNGFLLDPFNDTRDYALSHYYLQLPFYAKLVKDMLKGTKYEDITFLGGIIVLLKADGEFVEYRVPKEISNKIMKMDVPKLIASRQNIINLHHQYERRDNDLRKYDGGDNLF